MKKNFYVEALLIAIGLCVFGSFVKLGLESFTTSQRIVTVKGLSEKEVKANQVSWPLVYKEVGNDLPMIYKQLEAKNDLIINYLESHGIPSKDITLAAPKLEDARANSYSSTTSTFRYYVTSVITVTTDQVDLVLELERKQVELMQQGIPLQGNDYNHRTRYSFTELNAIKPQMIEEATLNARIAAQKFADDSQSQLGKIKKAYQGQFTITDRDPNTPYLKVVRVVNTVDYYLRD